MERGRGEDQRKAEGMRKRPRQAWEHPTEREEDGGQGTEAHGDWGARARD